MLLALLLANSSLAAGQPMQSAPVAALAEAIQPASDGSADATAVPPAASPVPTAASGDASNAAAPAPAAAPDAAATTDTTAADAAPALPAAAGPVDAALAEPRDPWVKVNRAIFSFDVTLERAVLAPVAHGYNYVVPHPVRYHVTKALFNLAEPLTAVNDLLQLRIVSMLKAVYRFTVNSTVGVAGLFDVAKSAGVPIHISDFGQTLGRYGVKPGPFVMLPLLGPSDVRDGVGRLVDTFIDPVSFVIGGITTPEGISLYLLNGIDWRSRSDETMKAIYSATDPYAFTRSVYTQSRAGTVSEATGKTAALPDFDAAPGTP